MKKYSFKNRIVLITGASSGIGKELSRCFAIEGSQLILCSHPSEEVILKAWCDELRLSYGVQVRHICADLAMENGAKKIFDEAIIGENEIDILVNNAGVMSYGQFHEIDPGTHDRLLMVNARAYMLLMRFFLPRLIASGQGRILNVCSVSAFQPSPHHAVYGATKAFVQSMSEAVNRELRKTGVRIMTLNPSHTDTPLLKGDDFPSRLRWYRLSGLQKPAYVAQEAVDALKKGRTIFVPGMRNRILHLFIQRFLPRSFTAWFADVVLKPS